MVDFAGWEMPVQYSTIIEEHHAVRRSAGLFDIAHMGRIRFQGPGACALLDHIVTNDVSKLAIGDVRYALVTNEQGGILDDVLVYRFPDCYMLVVNASNRVKILDWIEQHRVGFDVNIEDQTFETFMVALQGPQSESILRPQVDCNLAEMKYYSATQCKVGGQPAVVSRTGYTGEDGYEVIVSADFGLPLWEALMQCGAPSGLLPSGLGCRDTLRLEAAMPLYGHELDETIDPFTAGLAFGVKLDGGEFIGRDALRAAKQRTDRKKRVGVVLSGRRIAREGSLIFSGEAEVGRVTSGTFSPTLERSIAMAYVDGQYAAVDTPVEVDIRGKRESATVAKLPFYSRKS